MSLRPSKAHLRLTTLAVMLTFTIFSLCVPTLQAAARQQIAGAQNSHECAWTPKFEDFLSYNSGREYLASAGETPASFMNMVDALNADQREHLWTMLAPMHPASMAVEAMIANGYERHVAEELVAQLSPEELDAMVAYDHLEGSFHIGISVGLLILVVLVAILVFLIMDKKNMDHTAMNSDDELNHTFAALDGTTDHIKQLRADLGLERTEVPTF